MLSFTHIVVLASAIAMATGLPKPTDVPINGIVGGEPAVKGDFPFIVSIHHLGSHMCGGSLIAADTVLTAAHCSVIDTPDTFTIRADSLTWAAGGVTSNVSEIIVHPEYNSGTFDNDVAVWKLSQPLTNLTYATLPASGYDPAGGDLTTVAGWGVTVEGGSEIPDELLKVTVSVVDRATCNTQYEGRITTNMFCAGLEEGGKDSCQGDSGGPIIDDATGNVIGIVSWGRGCAQAGFSGVYANVGSLLSFIESA